MIDHAEQANASILGKYDILPFNGTAGVMDEWEPDVLIDAAADAIQIRNPGGLRDALARGADVNGRLQLIDAAGTHVSLLTYAALYDDIPPHACCKLLLAAGADVHQVDGGRFSPLCLAAKYDCPTLLALFLAAGADPNIRGEGPRGAPLLCAIYIGSRECALMLLRAGSKLKTVSSKWIREKLREAEALESPQTEPLRNARSLNNFLRLMRDNGGWEAHVKRHRALLVGRLRYWLRLPEDALGIIVDFAVPPGGS